ncbi:hypothetical protein BGX27_004800, partial [Mortierella sp. AM989]
LGPELDSLACTDCINKNIMALPGCKDHTYKAYADSSKFDETTNLCVCTMAKDFSWANSCRKTACPSLTVTLIQNHYLTYKLGNCFYASSPDVAGDTSAAGVLSAPKAGAAFAIAAAAAQALL